MDEEQWHWWFFMHARSGLQTEYMSKEWMECIEECAIEETSLGYQMMCCGGVMPFYEFEHIPGIDWLGKESTKDENVSPWSFNMYNTWVGDKSPRYHEDYDLKRFYKK